MNQTPARLTTKGRDTTSKERQKDGIPYQAQGPTWGRQIAITFGFENYWGVTSRFLQVL